MFPTMIKTAMLWCVCLFPVVYGVKVYAAAVALHDDHILTVARCMSRTVKALDISPQEAYLICEREVR